MILLYLKRNIKIYTGRLAVIWSIFIAAGIFYSAIGTERWEHFYQLVNLRMPILQKFISLKLLLSQGENWIRLFMVVIGIWLVFAMVQEVQEAMRQDALTGRLFYIVPSLMSREKYFILKYIGIGCGYLINVTIYYIGVCLGVWLAGTTVSWMTFQGELLRLFFVLLLFACVTVLWETIRSRNNEVQVIKILLVITLVLGNVHRLLSVLICILRMAGKGASVLFRIRRFFEMGYYVSPMSWSDSYHMYDNAQTVGIIAVCIVLSGVMLYSSLYIFRKKEIV